MVTRVSDEFADQRGGASEHFVTIAGVVRSTGIKPGHETRSAGRADGALAVGVSEGRARLDQGIDCRRLDMRVTQSADRVEALLIGTIPKNIGAACWHEIKDESRVLSLGSRSGVGWFRVFPRP